jgi:hypothetical protein
MAASSSRCKYCYKPTNSVSRHIQHVAACRDQWLADVNNLGGPSAMQDRGVGRIDNDEGWPMGGLGDDDNPGYDDAGRHRSISMDQTNIHGTYAPDDRYFQITTRRPTGFTFMNTLTRRVSQFAPPTQRLHVHAKPTTKLVKPPGPRSKTRTNGNLEGGCYRR